MVKQYRKGYIAELALVHELSRRGYMAIRTPRSGRINLASPDVIAAKDGRLIVFECKSRAEAFTVPQDQLQELDEWVQKAGAHAFVAWKISHKGWHFMHLHDVKYNKGNIGKKFAEEKSFSIEEMEKYVKSQDISYDVKDEATSITDSLGSKQGVP